MHWMEKVILNHYSWLHSSCKLLGHNNSQRWQQLQLFKSGSSPLSLAEGGGGSLGLRRPCICFILIGVRV